MPADFILPTELPPVDNTELLATAANTRRVLADPTGPYATRPDLREEAERNLAAVLLRAGATPPPAETAEMRAAAAHDASFRFRELPAGLVSTIDERSAAVVARGNVAEEAKALRLQLGDAEYDALLADAKAVRADLGGAAADLFALRMLAAQGKYTSAYNRTRPKP